MSSTGANGRRRALQSSKTGTERYRRGKERGGQSSTSIIPGTINPCDASRLTRAVPSLPVLPPRSDSPLPPPPPPVSTKSTLKRERERERWAYGRMYIGDETREDNATHCIRTKIILARRNNRWKKRCAALSTVELINWLPRRCSKV